MKTIHSIRTKQDFQALFDRGLILKGSFFKVWIITQGRGPAASEKKGLGLAIIVSRKTAARATDRNTWRRRIREIVRKKFASVLDGANLIVQVRKSGRIPSSLAIEEELKAIFGKIS